jgi:hypothetical protein
MRRASKAVDGRYAPARLRWAAPGDEIARGGPTGVGARLAAYPLFLSRPRRIPERLLPGV